MASERLRYLWLGNLPRETRFVIAGVLVVLLSTLLYLGNPMDGDWFVLRIKVVDQHGIAVPNALVTASLGKRAWLPFLVSIDEAMNSDFGLVRTIRKTTTRSGEAAIWGFCTSLQLNVTAIGYYPPAISEYSAVGPGNLVSDLPRPVVYRVWKLIGPQPLICSGIRVPGDGKTYWLDLLRGKIVDSPQTADLSVELHTAPQVSPSGQFAWSYVLRAARGGFVRTRDAYRFLAPPADYRPSVAYDSGATRSGFEIPQEHYYLRSRDGTVYSEVDFSWGPESGNVDVSYLANPAGSRILEPGLERRP
jgi:hypothetical protein